jgi:hypothetical protein
VADELLRPPLAAAGEPYAHTTPSASALLALVGLALLGLGALLL